MRSLLYEAASVILTRSSAESTLRYWGIMLWERIDFKRAAVAVARKLADIMHAMLKSGKLFDRSAGVPVLYHQPYELTHWNHSRLVMDLMVSGRSMRSFQALQQAVTMVSQVS